VLSYPLILEAYRGGTRITGGTTVPVHGILTG
jgi:hypothetical protein